MKAHQFKAIISDASVLIDYVKTNRRVLQLTVKHVCEVYVPLAVVNEVKDISLSEMEKLGLIIFEPTLDQMLNAVNKPFGLSFEDQLCFLIAKENGWVCATNDKQLRTQCAAEKVEVIWGLEIMALLNKGGYLEKSEAEKTAEKIGEYNRYISKELIKKFIAKLV